MNPIESLTQTNSLTQPRSDAFSDLSSEDFLKLLITQLTTQDPLEPAGNKELLEQISSIRDIELSTTLTDTLRNLAGEQRFGSATGVIGQYITSVPDDAGNTAAGIVTGIRLDEQGRPSLQLADGSTVPFDKVSLVESPIQAAERMIGQYVVGQDTRGLLSSAVEGVVTGARMDGGEVMLSLDSGQQLRLRDVQSAAAN